MTRPKKRSKLRTLAVASGWMMLEVMSGRLCNVVYATRANAEQCRSHGCTNKCHRIVPVRIEEER